MPSGNRDLRSTVDLAFARRREVLTEPIFKGRRPDLYMNLMTNSFMWNSSDFFRLYGYQPWPPGRKSRAAVVQFATADDVGANVARIAELCTAAIDREKPDLIVSPSCR